MRRKRKSSSGASLDSLLDTLTNVVGILVILLVVTQLGARDAVERIKEFVTEISAEQLAQAQSEAEELRRLLDERQQNWDQLDEQLPDVRIDLAARQKLIDDLKQSLKKIADAMVDPSEIQKLVDERKNRVASLEEKISADTQLIAKLKAQLAESPARGPDPEAKVVNLPNPRPAPPDSKPITFLCHDGHVVPVDVEGLRKKAQLTIRQASRSLIDKQGTIDCEKLVALFEKKTVATRHFRIKIGISSGSGTPYMILQYRKGEGDPTDRVASGRSLFTQGVRRVDPRKFWIRFRVSNDSFDTYLAARNQAARFNVAAGWTPYDAKSTFTESLGIKTPLRCQGFKPPPARPTTAKPAPTRPPPPRADVD